jgi:hypothetical protein
MWFALALLIFSAMYAAVRLFLPAPKRRQVDGKLPGHLAVAGLVLLITICTFLVRLVQPIGTSVMNMQLCFFSQYIILFAVGIIAYRKTGLPHSYPLEWPGLRWPYWRIDLLAGHYGSGAALWRSFELLGGFHWRVRPILFEIVLLQAYALDSSFFREHYNGRKIRKIHVEELLHLFLPCTDVIWLLLPRDLP